jgi:hypothetical protein
LVDRLDLNEVTGGRFMRKHSIFILVVLVFSQVFVTSLAASATPDYTSTHLPEIKSFKATVATVIRTEKAFGQDFKFESKEFIFDFTVRVHRNTISGLSIIMQGPTKTVSGLAAPCETFEGSIFSGALRYGSDYQSASSWSQLNGLQSRVQDGDFYIESYQLKGDMDWTFAADRNEGMGFCEGNYFLSQITIWDQAKRNIDLYLPGSGVATNFCKSFSVTCENGVIGTEFWAKNKLQSALCPKISGDQYFEYYSNCSKGDWKSMNFTISKTNTPTSGKLELVDYKTLYETILKDKTSMEAQFKTLTSERDTLASQATSLRSQVSTLTSEKSSLQSQVSTLTSEKSSLQSQVSTLTSEKSSLQSQVNSVKSSLDNFQKKLLAICRVKPKPKGC